MRVQLPRVRKNSKEYKALIEAARVLVHERLLVFNRMYGCTYKRVSIRNQKTRWGSASARGTLSFNYRIVYLPLPLADYIVVHELCHLREMNHSKAFWDLVQLTIPDYRERRRQIRTQYAF